MVLALIYTIGETSGAHLNPAVTVAFAARGNFPWRRVPGYVLAQLAGAAAAAGLLRLLFGLGGGLGRTAPGPGIAAPTALAVEIVLTFGLVTVILGTASGARNVGHNAAIAIGGYVALAGLWASQVSGASMNPARSLGPALVSGDLGDAWIYIAGPLAGGVLPVALAWALRGRPSAAARIAAHSATTRSPSPSVQSTCIRPQRRRAHLPGPPPPRRHPRHAHHPPALPARPHCPAPRGRRCRLTTQGLPKMKSLPAAPGTPATPASSR
jgi:aquaporin Z